jgi:hypothetical protein
MSQFNEEFKPGHLRLHDSHLDLRDFWTPLEAVNCEPVKEIRSTEQESTLLSPQPSLDIEGQIIVFSMSVSPPPTY